MMRLLDYINEESVFLLEKVDSFDAMIEVAAHVLAPKIECATDAVIKAVQQRELASSTAIGFGCAIPHAVFQSAAKTIAGIILLKNPLKIATPDGIDVDIVFIILGNSQEARIHLKLLSKIARILHEEETRNKLRVSKTIQEVMNIIGASDAD